MAREKSKPVFPAAARSKEFFDHLEAHYRECKRKKVDIDADVSLVLENGTVYSEGTAKVRDVSPSGALLSRLDLSKEAFPVKPFVVDVRMRSAGYEGIRFRCKPVRFVAKEKAIGVRFEEVSVEEKK